MSVMFPPVWLRRTMQRYPDISVAIRAGAPPVLSF
jgi:hypothetical protein